jgi:hypothetical protein
MITTSKIRISNIRDKFKIRWFRFISKKGA